MKNLYLLILSLLSLVVPAQSIINAYAKISSISASNILSLSNVNISNHTFALGDRVIIMQMQDDVIGSNTGNNSGFGNLSTIANAGKYEIAVISAITPTSGAPASITLSAALSATYNTGANSSVQLISFRNMGANFTTTSDITGLAWDGNVGGVIAFSVTNTLTLNHRIVADGLGFRGGAMSGSEDIGCDNTLYITSSNLKGFKGEGIYKNTNSNFTNARGKMVSGGGGGSPNNAGGGGGGNYTAGGDGGLGWQCTAGNSGSGVGGISLSANISADRVFMGGGGGGGQQNNNAGSAGGNGGGIILIQASTLATSTLCGSSIRISANGITAANSSNDGAGGGGAGGSVVIQAANYSINSACSLTVTTNAGNGGNVGDSGSHGGGGGGGQGTVIYSTVAPTTNVTTQTNNGSGGANSNAGGASVAFPGAGASNSGIIGSSTGPLPVELVSFKVEAKGSRALLTWLTASENNNDYFLVERSANGIEYTAISKIKGAGTSYIPVNYSTYDNKPLQGLSYYRLKQTDYNSNYKYSPVISVDFSEPLNFTFYPNPVKSDGSISFTFANTDGQALQVSIHELTGKEIYSEVIMGTSKQRETTLINPGLKAGIYLLKIQNSSSSQVKKLVVQ